MREMYPYDDPVVLFILLTSTSVAPRTVIDKSCEFTQLLAITTSAYLILYLDEYWLT